MNEKELKEIEEYINIKDSEKISKYGIDMEKELNKKIEQINDPKRIKKKKTRKKIRTGIIALSCLIIFLLVLIYSKIALQSSWGRLNTNEKDFMKFYGDFKVISKDVDLQGDGIYVFQSKKIPEITPHLIKRAGKMDEDTLARINKYYFEKWEDKDKSKFKVEEGFKENHINDERGNNFLIFFRTYIDVNNYQELVDATDAIIRFVEFKSDWKMPTDNFIRVGEDIIIPNNQLHQTTDEIKEEAKKQYIELVKRKGLSKEDIPKEEIEKY